MAPKKDPFTQNNEDKAFKNWINKRVVDKIASEIHAIYPAFNINKFKKVANKLEPLELKARVKLITESLEILLPVNYKKSLNIILQVTRRRNLNGFQLWPFSNYISQNGLNEFDASVEALSELTEYFTSEFAIRPFIERDHKKVLKYFKSRINDKNVHIRRWISEGSRPLLPWGQKLTIFIRKPELTLPLLEKLRFDEELYVRKSVANHLNDITKFHPQLVLDHLTKWKKNAPLKHQIKIEWIIRHALRTLIKKGDFRALKLIGASEIVKCKVGNLILSKSIYKVGEKIDFSFFLEAGALKPEKLVIDYKIHFRKANGTIVPKVFKLKTMTLPPQEKIEIKKSHSLKEITTMKFYPGDQAISVQVNGKAGHVLKWKLIT